MIVADHVTRETRVIAAQVRYFREMRGLTQEQLGALCDMQQEAISRLENTPDDQWTFPTLMRITSALDCHVDVRLDKKQREQT